MGQKSCRFHLPVFCWREVGCGFDRCQVWECRLFPACCSNEGGGDDGSADGNDGWEECECLV